MIYIADIASVGMQHEQFNKSFVELFAGTKHQNEILFWGDSAQAERIEKILPAEQVRSISVYSKRGGLKEFIRAYSQFRSLKKLVRAGESGHIEALYLLRIHPLAQFLFKMLTRTNVNVHIVLHGELESVKFNKHFANKIWGVFLRKAMTVHRPNIRYVILGQSIYKNLLQVIPSFSSQRTIVLDHPYPFTDQLPKKQSDHPITFASIGVATTAKNSHFFFQAAAQLKDLGLANRGRFYVCGQVYENMQPYLNDYVEFRRDKAPLSREELNNLVLASHFAVFYYEDSHYSLCPSGAFWDSINAELPLLYVSNDYFNFYKGIVGEIGLEFDTPDDLNNYIVEIAEKGTLPVNYSAFVSNIRKLKFDYMSKENLIRQLAQ